MRRLHIEPVVAAAGGDGEVAQAQRGEAGLGDGHLVGGAAGAQADVEDVEEVEGRDRRATQRARDEVGLRAVEQDVGAHRLRHRGRRRDAAREDEARAGGVDGQARAAVELRRAQQHAVAADGHGITELVAGHQAGTRERLGQALQPPRAVLEAVGIGFAEIGFNDAAAATDAVAAPGTDDQPLAVDGHGRAVAVARGAGVQVELGVLRPAAAAVALEHIGGAGVQR